MTLRDRIRAVVGALPDSASVTLPVSELRRWVDDPDRAEQMPATVAPSWREKLWTCPADTRLGVRDVAEALGRSPSWVYRAADAKKGVHRLPCRRLSGELVFEAGEVRAWVEREES